MTQKSANYSMRLSFLLEGFVLIEQEKNPLITSLAMDSREVSKGCLFLACRSVNQHEHGSTYIETAINAGAIAVVVDVDAGQLDDKENDVLTAKYAVPLFFIERLDQKMGLIADRFYRHPSQNINVIGITGTNGKTSCAQFLAQCLHTSESKCGLLGTLGVGIWNEIKPSRFTTPLALSLQKNLSDIRDAGAIHTVMEVSSHALAQGRANGVKFNIAMLTNLTRDHLDYHGDMASYALAKQKLFEMDGLQWLILNADDSFGRTLLTQNVSSNANKIAYGLRRDLVASQDYFVFGELEQLSLQGMRFRVATSWGNGVVDSPLLGRFNVNNLLAVLAALLCMKIPLEKAISLLERVQPPAGRIEKFAGGDSKPLVVVDYSHTPDALEQVLSTLREHCKENLWLVFGCGGDRDAGKRPQMAAVAEKFASRIIITDDNPRNEDAQQITDDILAGFAEPDEVIVVHDRAQAIAITINQAAANDIVLIAGKGHEDYQIVGDLRIPFSDRELVLNALKEAA